MTHFPWSCDSCHIMGMCVCCANGASTLQHAFNTHITSNTVQFVQAFVYFQIVDLPKFETHHFAWLHHNSVDLINYSCRQNQDLYLQSVGIWRIWSQTRGQLCRMVSTDIILYHSMQYRILLMCTFSYSVCVFGHQLGISLVYWLHFVKTTANLIQKLLHIC